MFINRGMELGLQAGATGYKPTFINTLRDLGYTSALQVCLDAGDGDSAPSGATSWLDTSGNGYDFFRGTGSGGEAADPTFTGTVGNLSSGEYWAHDGADYFRYDTTNETWMQDMHKDNAQWTFMAWIYMTSALSMAFLGDAGTSGGRNGVSIRSASGSFQLSVTNAGSSVQLLTFGTAMPLNAWQFIAVSQNELDASTGLHMRDGGNSFTGNGTYTSPSAANATATMEIGARGNGGEIVNPGTRFGMVSLHAGGFLTAGQIDNVYQRTRLRYGV